MAQNSSQKYLVLDYETRSEIDLKKVGAWEYSKHPSTKILCAGFRIGTRKTLRDTPVEVWSPVFQKKSDRLLTALTDEKVQIIAHNAFFEQCITRNVLRFPLEIPISRWICTASVAAYHALPRNLENLCMALTLPIQKDVEGRRLVLKYCKPRKPTKNDKSKWHCKISDLKRIMEYCKVDVLAETEVFLKTGELPRRERKLWELDQKINAAGFLVDRDLILHILKLIEEETKALDAEISEMTEGELHSARQRDAVLKTVKCLPDLRAKTVVDALADPKIQGRTRRILEIRQAISKSSTAKYLAFEMRSRSDGRIRDSLVYHGASTGRWSGAGIQPQNFPRGTIKGAKWIPEIIKGIDD